MNLLYGMVCEDASSREDGRVDVAGIFHQLYAPGFPAQQERMVLAAAVEWNAGEAAGHLAAFCRERRTVPRAVCAQPGLLAALQGELDAAGIERAWPE